MFLLIWCVEVSQSQGGFEVQSSQFMSLLLGAYLNPGSWISDITQPLLRKCNFCCLKE